MTDPVIPLPHRCHSVDFSDLRRRAAPRVPPRTILPFKKKPKQHEGNPDEQNRFSLLFDASAERKRSWSLPPQVQENTGGGCDSPLVVEQRLDKSKLLVQEPTPRRSVSPNIRQAGWLCSIVL